MCGVVDAVVSGRGEFVARSLVCENLKSFSSGVVARDVYMQCDGDWCRLIPGRGFHAPGWRLNCIAQVL